MIRIVIASLCLFLVACGGSNTQQTPTDVNEDKVSADITMTVDEDSLEATGAKVIIENKTEEELTYGEDFLIEEKQDDEWVEAQLVVKDGEYGFNDIGYLLDPASKEEETIDWEWLYGQLKAGEYRIVKTAHITEEPGDSTEYTLLATFTLAD